MRSCPVRPSARIALLAGGLAVSLAAQDAERATHTDSASSPQVSFETKGEDFVLRQYQLGCLSHLSYLVVSRGVALVVDPQRDVEHYIADAAALGAKIGFVALTHPHADFVAGHTELARAVGAQILIGDRAGAEFPHRELHDGDKIEIGAVTLESWNTPGHTPNAQTFLLHVPGAKVDPAYALTGDTLFIGSIGRPDLLDDPPAELASQSFDSIARLSALPADTMVLPAHGAGSLCGAHLSPDTTSTIGKERATNPYLQIRSRATFVANVISHQPIAPQYFRFNVELNRKGPPLVERDTGLPAALDAASVQRAVDAGGWVVDLRDAVTYARGHVEGSVNVALRGRLDTWTGIVVPFDAPLVLVGDDDAVREGVFRLRRIGYDHVAGRLDGGIDAWRAAGRPVRQSRLVEPKALFAAMEKGAEPVIVDVRTRDEFEDLRLGDVGNIPVTESERFAKTLDRTQPVVMVCNSAYRSSMAVGLAERAGFTDVASLDGGIDAWVEAGLPVKGRMATTTAAMPAATRIALPEPVDPALLARVLMDQPSSYAVIDLRPAWQFAEWHVGASVNVEIDALADHIASVGSDRRIVLVDRDGTTAFAVAGALMARDGARELRVLVGGVARYYREIELGSAAPSTAGGGGVVTPSAAEASTTPAASPTAAPKKKRNAGC
ncbi:MAG: rhodanese-like domain-containing protein [Planctomycetota bacterium]